MKKFVSLRETKAPVELADLQKLTVLFTDQPIQLQLHLALTDTGANNLTDCGKNRISGSASLTQQHNFTDILDHTQSFGQPLSRNQFKTSQGFIHTMILGKADKAALKPQLGHIPLVAILSDNIDQG